MRSTKNDETNAIENRIIAKCDRSGHVIKEYTSVKDAAADNGILASDIRQAAQGKVDKVGNYFWIYIFKDEYQQNIYLEGLKATLFENGYSSDFLNSFLSVQAKATDYSVLINPIIVESGLKDLYLLIKQSTIHFNRDFIWQDVCLKDEFKDCYENYLNGVRWRIEFFDYTAVLTTPTSKNIFIPNQWFVIAAYAVGVYTELQRYKMYFERVAELLGHKIDVYAKELRDNTKQIDKQEFIDAATLVLKADIKEQEELEKSVKRLWRFVTDYSWWSGQKTIDRGDYFQSVVLNMLNLVNSSQGYVGDIVNAYGTDKKLFSLVQCLENFTVNMDGETYLSKIVDEKESIQETIEVVSTNGNPTKHKITISAYSIKKIGGE